MTVTVRFLGGLKHQGRHRRLELQLPDGATVRDLETALSERGIDVGSGELVVTVNGRGLRQWPPHRPVSAGDEVAVFRAVAGG